MKYQLYLLLWASISGYACQLYFAQAVTINGIDITIAPGRYLILILDRLGLANRLRALADWHNIAVQSNRILLISWKATYDCNITFSELFEAGPPTLKVLPFIIANENEVGHRTIAQIASAHNLSSRALDSDDITEQRFFLPRNIFFSDVNIISTSYESIVTLEGTRCQQYMAAHSRFLSSMVPVERARNIVADVLHDQFRNKLMIGVHIRAHDPFQDWEVVPPGAGNPKAVKFGDGATIDDFEGIMRDIRDYHRYVDPLTKQVVDNVKFFVASNSEVAKQHIYDRFPGLVVALQGNHDRMSPEGMLFSFVEWLLLSESSLLVNTFGSTFAPEAALKSLTPIVSIWNHHIIHQLDSRLPFCGHMTFIVARGKQGRENTVIEGTYDNRAVTGRLLPMKPCTLLEEFGLKEAYCTMKDEEAVQA